MSRIKFQRSKNLNLHNHLFQLKADKLGEKEPFLINIMADLSAILEKGIKYLQELYQKDKEHQIYISFSQQMSPVLGITSGNYILIYKNEHAKK